MLGEHPNQAKPVVLSLWVYPRISRASTRIRTFVGLDSPSYICTYSGVIDKLWRFTLISHKCLSLSKIRVSTKLLRWDIIGHSSIIDS